MYCSASLPWFHGFSGQVPAAGISSARFKPPPGGHRHPQPLPLTLPHNPHPQARGASGCRIGHRPGVKQPGRLRLHRRQGRPIELPELLPLGEQQHGNRCAEASGYGATNCGRRICNWLPHALALHRFAVRLLHPQIRGDLLGAHLGVNDRQLGAFFQQVAADAVCGGYSCGEACARGVVGVGLERCTAAPVASQRTAMLLMELMRWLPNRWDSARSRKVLVPTKWSCKVRSGSALI